MVAQMTAHCFVSDIITVLCQWRHQKETDGISVRLKAKAVHGAKRTIVSLTESCEFRPGQNLNIENTS